MKFSVVTLFPSLIEGFCGQGLLAGARERGLVRVECVNPREFTSDVHGTVDDRAFGGGDGMVMKCEPLAAAIESLRAEARVRAGDTTSAAEAVRVIVLSPSGTPWTQSRARDWAERGGHVALVCGRYAGIDQRFVEAYADEEISLGDFVLNGGEIAALALIESVARLIPGVLGNSVSAEADSFTNNLLEAPQFTRPREWVTGANASNSREQTWIVPSPLLSGNHAEIAKFLHALGVVRTEILRPGTVKASLRESLALVSPLSDLELKSLGISREDLAQISV